MQHLLASRGPRSNRERFWPVALASSPRDGFPRPGVAWAVLPRTAEPRFDLGKLRVANRAAMPKCVQRLFPPTDAQHAERHLHFIDHSAVDVEDQRGSCGAPLDPVLTSSKDKRHEFFVRPLNFGLLGAHLHVKQTVGCFFVEQKDGNIRVVSSTVVAATAASPPKTFLGGLLGLRELDFSGLDVMRRFVSRGAWPWRSCRARRSSSVRQPRARQLVLHR